MAPVQWSSSLLEPTMRQSTRSLPDASSISTTLQLSTQWQNPSDILSVLLILGPDVVQRAIAQLVGRRVTPVAFSFGWVAYSISALLSAVGDGYLMPAVDVSNVLVVGAQSGHIRNTNSWVLGRLLRDLNSTVDEEMMRKELQHVPSDDRIPKSGAGNPTSLGMKEKKWEPLRLSIFQVLTDPVNEHGTPFQDKLWFSGFAVIAIELAISTLPWILKANWAIFMITLCGTALAIVGGSLTQWREEKWACGKKGGATITLTKGNGSRHAIVILGNPSVGLDLEVLATGTRTVNAFRLTRIAICILALLWIILLITVAALKADTWYLLIIGAIGSIQNIIAAGSRRKPGALGVHIKLKETLTASSVAGVLKEVEARYPLVGTSLIPVFFPGSMRVQEADFDFWRHAQQRRTAPNRWGTRIDTLYMEESESIKHAKREGTISCARAPHLTAYPGLKDTSHIRQRQSI